MVINFLKNGENFPIRPTLLKINEIKINKKNHPQVLKTGE